MYSGYVFFCNNESQEKCLAQKLYSCAGAKPKPTEKIKKGSVLFLYNTETNRLLGPFTALSEGGEPFETGAWKADIDYHSASENVKVEWEELHQLENAASKLPFLNNPLDCSLSPTQTQRALDLLKQAPLYLYQKNQESTTT